MADPQQTVFISYRRDASWELARLIFNDLHARGYDVFIDVESIGSGDWLTNSLNQIAARAHFLVILAPGTLKRCEEPGDPLRREIEHAINLQRNVIPVLTHGFEFNKRAAKYLTGTLADLPRYNGLSLSHELFAAGLERLRTQFLGSSADVIIHPAPPADQPTVEQKIEAAAAAPAPTPDELTAEEYFNRGFECIEADDYAEAIENYTQAIRLNPQYAAAHYNRGVARYNQGDLAGAVADYDEAIRLDPQFAAAYNNRGIARAMQGDLAGALADCDEAIRLDPQYAAAYNNRGVARYKQGDLAGAGADYDEAIRLNPQYADAYNNRGAARYKQGDLAGAGADYDEAIRLNPQYATAYTNRGEVRFALKAFAEALTDFRKANELRPSYNFALAGLAITHHALRNKREARRLWRVLIGMDARYRDIDWVKSELNWHDALADEARKLVAGL